MSLVIESYYIKTFHFCRREWITVKHMYSKEFVVVKLRKGYGE